jgi:hypothetical protein
MEFKQRIALVKSLGYRLKQLSERMVQSGPEKDPEFGLWLDQVKAKNPWFTTGSMAMALEVWSNALLPEAVDRWVAAYPMMETDRLPRTIGVINAGNIPFVGLHDLLCVFMSGHHYQGKNASEDPFLLPMIVKEMATIDPTVSDVVRFVDKLSGMDAVIATGSNNSARYFESYFGKYPHVIRKNRNAIALITGFETGEELAELGKDIFSYYGLGCRNVSKLYIPVDYDLSLFFESIYGYHEVMNHHKYMNNFDYHHAVYLLKQIPFLQNNFLILKEDEMIASPLAVVHYERYDNWERLLEKIGKQEEEIQCIAVSSNTQINKEKCNSPVVPFGQTQAPTLDDYADGVDTMKFLLEIA